ncbi:MAG: flavin reductase family protein [Pseudomonadota bacterium]
MTEQLKGVEAPDHRGRFITAMRSVAGTVAVVTTNGPAGKHGATVSAFCSVSADPPSLLVCLHSQSRIAELVRQNKNFSVNVLPQSLDHVADRFAGKDDAKISDRFDGIDCFDGTNNCPGINRSITFECDLASDMLSGSHWVIVGNVSHICGQIDKPLTYLNGAYYPWIGYPD